MQRAVDAIGELRKQAEAGKLLDVKQAQTIFDSQILATFISEINQIKTKSVRESRLANQVPDLKNLFKSTVIPAIEQAIKNNEIFKKQIPEFATGGHTREGLAYLHDGEVVLNSRQTQPIANSTPVVNVPGEFGGSGGPVQVTVNLSGLQVTQDGAVNVLEIAATSSDGRAVIVNVIKDDKKNGGL